MRLQELVGAVAPRFVARVDEVVHPAFEIAEGARVPRAMVAHALVVALFADLLERVPVAAEYVDGRRAGGHRVMLDHGAVRTVAWPTPSPMPAGVEQVTRVLEPLGYREVGRYPLPRLHMTGRSFAHDDLPESVAQWFVSELHPDEFSPVFRAAVERVLGTAPDPLDERTLTLLAELQAERSLEPQAAVEILPALVGCFRRQHAPALAADYELLLEESAEMAWIATEGTSFNHATDRVDDVEAVAAAQRRLGRPIKDRVEVSSSGRVHQTAFRASPVARTFRTAEGDEVVREVPGSFFEFIQRAPRPDGSLDLAFDTSNAQGIFTMTSATRAR